MLICTGGVGPLTTPIALFILLGIYGLIGYFFTHWEIIVTINILQMLCKQLWPQSAKDC